ncbi:hypothetical protein CONLIGDRAFT_660762 [Coniochaeta ligniaria NRRL 30616]|uniref:Mitochondrial adapter protein MCP1 transmembrane domain-containing protein n=1 Tax=Coniochaeta ligniaria NRRL 30616 TaxID=1408157 RepID=A0A1J7JSQ3_9PEZI|nr:hypothetical protein CONLIGDRAFT_660762 [Coniochaeta ligniaria NRRL 30616]
MDTRSLHEKASEETLISLLQLDPSPIESPELDSAASDEKQLGRNPNDEQDGAAGTLKSSTSSLGLSGNAGHGAIYYLSRIQRYSSYTFTVFTALHLATTSLIPLATLSVPASESYLLLAREIYQTPLSEPLLVALPALAHVASGIALRLLRRSQNLRRYGGATPAAALLPHLHRTHPPTSTHHRVWPPLSWISRSGYVLAVAVGLHAFVNRGLPLIIDGDSANIGLAYVSHGFARHPALSWVAYAGLLAVGCGHVVWGWAKWFGVAHKAGWRAPPATGNARVDREVRRRRRRVWYAVNGVVVSILTLGKLMQYH